MTVTNVTKDEASLSINLTAEFDAPAEKVWDLWADPRKLEKWWGPPGYPTTVVDYDFTPGGSVGYYMTGPGGEQHHGWWRFVSVQPPASLEFEDGFADKDGSPSTTMPVATMRVSLTTVGGRTHMEIRTTYATLADLEKVAAMGMMEGIRLAAGQMDAILAAA
jgi:uncharacterized protein YndB with AHSA1/START domain